MSDRFSVVQDPCGIYFLWDEVRFEPVMDGDQIMVFVTQKDAVREAFRINGPANDDAPRDAACGTLPAGARVIQFEAVARRTDQAVLKRGRDGQRRQGPIGSASLRFNLY